MIPQEELTDQAVKYEVNLDRLPDYRMPKCLFCQIDMINMYHIWHHHGNFLKEQHICLECGKKYMLEPDIPENLIVIASHDRPEFIENTLKIIHEDYFVLVVDTRSIPEKFEETKKICKKYFVKVCQTPYSGFDTGAYLWAYFNYPAKNYMFIQDSVTPKDNSFIYEFINRGPVVSWVGYFHPHHKLTGQPGCDPNAIFGPNFYSSKEALDTLRDKNLFPAIPKSKHEAILNEFLWAENFRISGMNIEYLYSWHDPDTEGEMINGQFPIFIKQFPRRE